MNGTVAGNVLGPGREWIAAIDQSAAHRYSRTRIRNSTAPDGRERTVESPPGHVSPGISPLHAARLYDML